MSERDGFATVELTAAGGDLRAELVPELGMLCCSLEHRGEQLLGVRGGVSAYAERGSTMGIPLLFPWANRLAGWGYEAAGKRVQLAQGTPLISTDQNGLPIHGILARHLRFGVQGQTEASVDAAFESEGSHELAEVFPYRHRLEVAARLSDGGLEITTTVIATGDDRVPVAFGYHPYLRLPGVQRADWAITTPLRTKLLLDELMIPTGATAEDPVADGPLGTRTFDDAYTGMAGGATFTLAGGGRTITVRFHEGYPFAQIYAPPDQDVICFEPMTAPADALASGRDLRVLEPGQRHSGRFSVSVA
jgi:aldose 1-epimerase